MSWEPGYSPDVIEYVFAPGWRLVGDDNGAPTQRERVADPPPAAVVQFRQELAGTDVVPNADPSHNPDRMVDGITDTGPAGAEQVARKAE